MQGRRLTFDGIPRGMVLLLGRIAWGLALEALDDERVQLDHLRVGMVQVKHALPRDARRQRGTRGEDGRPGHVLCWAQAGHSMRRERWLGAAQLVVVARFDNGNTERVGAE